MKIAVRFDITALINVLKRKAHEVASGHLQTVQPRAAPERRRMKRGGRDGIGRA